MNRMVPLIVSLVGLLVISGCARKPKGVYVSEQNPYDYIELNDDGTFYLKQGEETRVGKFELREKTVTLVVDRGQAVRFRLEGNKLIDEEGFDYFLWSGGTTSVQYEDSLRAIRHGVYFSMAYPYDYFELRKDGSLYAKIARKEHFGRYDVETGSITLVIRGEKPRRLRLGYSRMIDEEGNVFVPWEYGTSAVQYEDTLRVRRLAENREAVRNDLLQLAARAQQYFRRPPSLGGGGGSFLGLTPDASGFAKLSSRSRNRNGSYKILKVSTDMVVLVGAGMEKEADGEPTRLVAEVTQLEVVVTMPPRTLQGSKK